MAKQLNVDVNINTAKAEAALKNLQQLLTQAIQGAGQGGNGALTKEIVKATQEAAKLKTMLASATDTRTGQLNLAKFNQQLSMNGTNLQSYSKSLMSLGPAGEKAFLGLAKSVVSTQAPVKQANTMLTQLGTTLKNTARWQLSSTMLHAFIGGIQSAFSYARGLNDSLNSIRIVTGQSADQMDRFAESANKSAKALSTSTLDYTDAALIYYQQGIRDEAEIKARTDATIKMANVTGQSAEKVSQQMTAIWNNFANGATNLEYFADVITALGANTASSSAEISTGLEKFAAVAETVGLSYEYATSALATITATTRQSADIVGTALKTLFARIQDLDLGETLEDGTTLGKYSQALDAVGISIKDQNGELRSMDAILDDMGAKWETLNKDQQVALAQTVAGTRQYTQLVALMDNWDFMKENLQIAYDSEGTLQQQQGIYEESWKAAKERVKASMQGLTTDLISDDFFIGFNDALAGAISGIDKFIDSLGGLPGLLGLIGVVATRVFGTQVGQQMDKAILKLKEMTGIAQVEQQQMQKTMVAAVNKMSINSTGPEDIEARSIQRQINMSSQLLAMKDRLTQSDLNQAQALIEVSAAYDEVAIKAAAAYEASEVKATQAIAASQSRVRAMYMQKYQNMGSENAYAAAQIDTQKYSGVVSQLQNVIQASEKVKASLNSLGTSKTAILSLTEGATSLAEAFSLVLPEFEEIQFAITEIGSNDAIQKWVSAASQYKNILEEIGELEKIINNPDTSASAKATAIQQLTEAQERLKTAEEELNNAMTAGQSAIKSQIPAFTEAAESVDSYLLNLVKTNELTAKEATELRKLIPVLQENAAEFEKLALAEERAAEMATMTKEVISSMKATASVTAMGQAMTSALGAVSSLAMGISSLKGAVDALNNDDLSFGEKLMQVSLSGSMGLSMLAMGLMQLGPAFAKVGAGIKSGLLSSIAIATGNTERLALAVKKAGDAGISMGAGLAAAGAGVGSFILAILPAIVLLGSLIAIVALTIKKLNELKAASPEGKLKAAQEEASNLAEQLREAKGAAEELKSAFDGYNSIKDKLAECAVGTQAWTDALRENNSQVLELLSKYPELAGMQGAIIQGAHGALIVSEDAQDQLTQQAQDRIDTLSAATIYANQKVTEASQLVTDKNIANRMAADFNKGKSTNWNEQLFGNGINGDFSNQSSFDVYSGYAGLNGDFFEKTQKVTPRWENPYVENAIGSKHERTDSGYERSDATTAAMEAIVKNGVKILNSDDMVGAVEEVLTSEGIKVNDIEGFVNGLKNSSFLSELYNNEVQKAAQKKAADIENATIIRSALVAQGYEDNPNLDTTAAILGKQLPGIVNAAKEGIMTELEDGSKSHEYGQEYASTVGGRADSIKVEDWGIEFINAKGEWDKATNEMIANTVAMSHSIGEASENTDSWINTVEHMKSTGEAGTGFAGFLETGELGDLTVGGLQTAVDMMTSKGGLDALKGQIVTYFGGMDRFQEYAEMVGSTTEQITADYASMAAETAQEYHKLYNEFSHNQIKDIAEDWGLDSTSGITAWITALQSASDNLKLPDFSGPIKGYEDLKTEVEGATEFQKAFNKNITNGTKLSDQAYAALQRYVGETTDLSGVIDTANGNLITNAQALQKIIDLQDEAIKKDIEHSEAQEYLRLDELTKQLDELTSEHAEWDNTEEGIAAMQQFALANEQAVSAILEEINSVESQIAQYQRLKIALSGAADGYERMSEARALDEATDTRDEFGSAISRIKELNKNKEWGTEEFRTGLEALVPDSAFSGNGDWITEGMNYINNKLSRYYTADGSSYNVTYENAKNFKNDALNTVITDENGNATGQGNVFERLEDGSVALNKNITSLQQFAEQMGVTETVALTMLESIGKYSKTPVDFIAQLAENSDDFSLKLMSANQELASLIDQQQQAMKDGDWPAYKRLQQEIDAAREKITGLKQSSREQVDAYIQGQKEMSDAMQKAAQVKARYEEQHTDITYDDDGNITGGKLKSGINPEREVTVDMVTDADKEAEAAFTEFTSKFENAPVEVQFQLRQEEVQQDLANIDAKLVEYEGQDPETTVTITISGEGEVTKTLADLEADKEKLSGEDVQLSISTGMPTYEETKGQIDDLEESKIQPKDIECDYSQLVEAKAAADNLKSMAYNAIKSKEITITTNYVTNGTPPGPTSPAFGTARASGSAYESGYWGLPRRSNNALVGELGQELVVDPHRGTYYTVGDSGAELVNLPKDAIIFNHRQTEELFKNRKINNRGQAVVEGTAMATGNAYGIPRTTSPGAVFDDDPVQPYVSPTPVVVPRQSVDNSKKVANNTQTAAAAAGEFVEYQEEALKILRLEVDWYKELNRQVSKLNHELKSLSRNNDRLTGQAWFDNYEKQLKIMDQVWKKDKEISKKRQEDYKDTLKQLTYNNEIQYQYKALSSHSDDKSNKYNTLAATSDVNAIQTLLDYGKLDNSAVTLDANGNLLSINDVTALQEAALTGYNADVAKYNEMIGREDLTEAQQTEAENFKNYYEAKWKKINELIDEATTREEEMYKAIEDAQDALEAMHDLAQQAIVKRLELKVSVTDSATKILDFKMRRLQGSVSAVADSMQKLYNFSNSELFVAIDRLFNPDSTASTNFYKKGEDKFSYILTNLSAYADFYYESEDAVNRLFSDPKAITSESDRQNLIKFIEGATGELNKLLDLVDDMGKKGTEVIEQFSKQISTLTSVMSSNVSILEHFKNLADLLGLSSDYDLLEGIVESQLEANKTMWKTAEEELVAAKSYRDNAVEVYQGLVDSGDVKAAEFYKTSMLEPAEKYYEETLSKAQQATIKYAQSIQDKWTTTMEKIMSSWEKTATLGSNFDALTKSMEKAKSISSLLVTETNKLYETNTLLRKLNQDINKTDSLASKEKLQAFALEIQNRQKDNKMTKDSLDILKARYELLQAEMALEDAKNAKSTVRLQRDNEGNYGYVYTADQDDIADAEQNLADKQNDLYNLVLNQQQDNYERMIQSRQEYLARVKEIMNDATIDETERTRQLNEARRQFEEEWSIYDANMLESAYYLNKEATEGISEAWNTQFADRTLKTEEWVALCDEKEKELKVLLDDINAKREEVKNDTVTGLGDIKQRTKDIIDENDKLSKQITQSIIPTMTSEMTAVSNLTEAFSKQLETIDQLIDYYQDLIDKARQALQVMSMVDRSNMSYDHSEKMNEYYMQGDLEGWSSENTLRSDVAKNMSKHGGYMTNNLELAALQIYAKDNGLDWTDVRDSAWAGNTNFTGDGADVINYMGSQGSERSHNNSSDQTPLVQYILDSGNEQMLVGMNLDQYNMDPTVKAEAKRIQNNIASGATGMYTGEWGDEGKLAILHEKELVLNAADTENILDTVNMLREITRQIDIRSAWTNMIADMAAPSLAELGNDTIQQEVHITAEFPNAQDKNEILDAFRSLVNEAAQFANRY